MVAKSKTHESHSFSSFPFHQFPFGFLVKCTFPSDSCSQLCFLVSLIRFFFQFLLFLQCLLVRLIHLENLIRIDCDQFRWNLVHKLDAILHIKHCHNVLEYKQCVVIGDHSFVPSTVFNSNSKNSSIMVKYVPV